MSDTILPVLSAVVPNSEAVLGSHTKNTVEELKGLSLNIQASNEPGALLVSILLFSYFCYRIYHALLN